MKLGMFLFCLVTLSVTGGALAGTGIHRGKVTSTLTQEGVFGNCMALITPSPSQTLPSCRAGWVTFSCSGDFNSKSAGQTKFSQAQLGLVTGNGVVVVIDDTKTHNGYCFANRIDVFFK